MLGILTKSRESIRYESQDYELNAGELKSKKGDLLYRSIWERVGDVDRASSSRLPSPAIPLELLQQATPRNLYEFLGGIEKKILSLPAPKTSREIDEMHQLGGRIKDFWEALTS